MPQNSSCQAPQEAVRANALENASAYLRFTTRTTAVSQFGQKHSFCPVGVRSREATPKQPWQGGAGESMYDFMNSDSSQ